MVEEWKDIKGYEGLYQVSNKGNVRTLEHKIVNKLGRTQLVKGRNLKIHTYPNGYKDVMLQNKGVAKRYLVHRLVAEAFIPNPENFSEVNHKDESRDNNVVTNLEWCSRKYNCNYGSCIEKQRNSKLGKTLSEQHKKKISETLKGRVSPNKGKITSEETKEKLRLAMTGRTYSEETRLKMSEARKKYWERKRGN